MASRYGFTATKSSGEQMIDCAQTIRGYEPLSIHILRKHFTRIHAAEAALNDALGKLMRDLA